MVSLRSGRILGNVELKSHRQFYPRAPADGMLLLFPMKVGKYFWPDKGSQKYSHLAIVGCMTTCIGHGTDFESAANDAAFKLDGYFEDDYIKSEEKCYSRPDDPFYMEKVLLDNGMRWRGRIIDCEGFLTVSQGKVSSFGWHKKGHQKWHVFELPRLESLA